MVRKNLKPQTIVQIYNLDSAGKRNIYIARKLNVNPNTVISTLKNINKYLTRFNTLNRKSAVYVEAKKIIEAQGKISESIATKTNDEVISADATASEPVHFFQEIPTLEILDSRLDNAIVNLVKFIVEREVAEVKKQNLELKRELEKANKVIEEAKWSNKISMLGKHFGQVLKNNA